MKKPNKFEQDAAILLKRLTGIEPMHEHRFDMSRRWRFDLAYVDQKVAIEVEGGVWAGGRHVRPKGFIDDCEKYNAAASQGWLVLRLVPDMIEEKYLRAIIGEVLALRFT